MCLVRGLLVTTLITALTSSIHAEDKKPVKAEGKKPIVVKAKDPYAALFTYPKTITLDEKQKAEVVKLQAESTPKLVELAKKQNAILTPERTKAANEARKKASNEVLTPDRVKAANEARKKAADDGKKGKELNQIYNEALKLTADEQKKLKDLNKVYDETLKLTADEQAQIKEINQARGKLQKEINEKKQAILTDEQKTSLKAKPKKDK